MTGRVPPTEAFSVVECSFSCSAHPESLVEGFPFLSLPTINTQEHFDTANRNPDVKSGLSVSGFGAD